MRSYTKHAEGHLGWVEIAPLEGWADALGALWEGPDQQALALSKKTRTHTEDLQPERTRGTLFPQAPLNGARCCPQTLSPGKLTREQERLLAILFPLPACLPLKFLLILIIADHRGRSTALWEMIKLARLWTKRVHRQIFKSFPFPLPEHIPPW